MRERIDFRCASCTSQAAGAGSPGWPGLFLPWVRRSGDRTGAAPR